MSIDFTPFDEEITEVDEIDFTPFSESGEWEEAKEKPKPLPLPLRLAGKVPAELFGGAMGAIPELAEHARQLKPFIEEKEEEARPSFLGSTGLEPASEKGLLNLLSLLGQTDFFQKMRPARLRERFKETTGERFEPQGPVERVLGRAAGAAGEGLPLGIPVGLGALGGAAGGIAEEAGVEPGGQALIEAGTTGLGAVLKGITKVPKVPKTKPSGLPVRKFEKLKKPTRVFRGTTEKAIQETKKDFNKLTSDLLTKTNRSYKAILEDPTFKSTVSDLFEKVESSAKDIKKSTSSKNLANELRTKMRKTGEKAISLSDSDITKRTQLKKYFNDTVNRKVNPEELLTQFRKNNEQLSKLYPYGDKALENIGKREALETYNRAIANFIEENYKDTQFSDLFKFTNKRWSEIKKIETVDKYLDALFKGDKIDFRQAEKAVTDPKYSGRLKNALGKEGFSEFKQINKDLLSKEQTLKLLKAKGFDMDYLSKKAIGYLIKPTLTKGVIAKDFVSQLWRTSLSKPQYVRQWRKGLSLFKRGHVKEAVATLKSLEKSITANRNDKSPKPTK